MFQRQRPPSPGPSYTQGYTPRRPSTPPPFSAVGAGRRGSFSSSLASNYTYSAPSPARTTARAASPSRPPSWSTPRYVPAGPPARSATPPGRRRPSFGSEQRSPSPARWSTGAAPFRKLEIHGDSFVGVFNLLPQSTTRIFKHKGASAKGLNNVNSTLGVGQTLLKQLEKSRPSQILLMFGHVDLHINYLWQLKAKGPEALKPSDWVRSVVQQYTAFIGNELLPRLSYGEKVYIAAVTPPVVEDYYLEMCVQKYTDKEMAGPLPPLSMTYHAHDMTTRRAMVRAFNQLLGTFCSRHPQLELVNVNRHLTVGGGDQVSPSFIDRVDPTNIHLLWERTISFWCAELPPLRGVGLKDSATLERQLEGFHLEKKQRMLGNGVTRGLVVR